MIEIIPNWHPLFVHFTIGLLLTSAMLSALGTAIAGSPFAPHATVTARWNLWIGTAFAVITVAAGYCAYYTIAHDELGDIGSRTGARSRGTCSSTS